MKKKLLIFSIITFLILVIITFATAVNTEKTNKKISPLYGIRTSRAINTEKIKNIKEIIKARFVGERVFFLPFQWLRNKIHDDSAASLLSPTCYGWPCTYEKTMCTCVLKYCS